MNEALNRLRDIVGAGPDRRVENDRLEMIHRNEWPALWEVIDELVALPDITLGESFQSGFFTGTPGIAPQTEAIISRVLDEIRVDLKPLIDAAVERAAHPLYEVTFDEEDGQLRSMQVVDPVPVIPIEIDENMPEGRIGIKDEATGEIIGLIDFDELLSSDEEE